MQPLRSKTNKGFVNIILLVGVGAVLFIGGVLLERYHANQFGATVIDTNLSDTLGTFRTNVNTSIDNLNTQLVQVSSSVSGLGTMSAVNSPAPVANGGTGTSTIPGNNKFLIADGNTPTWKTLASSTGITLTITSTTVTLGSPGFDNTANINFTGNNTFAGTSGFNGTTTFGSAATTTFNSTVSFNSSTKFVASNTFSGIGIISPQIPQFLASSTITGTPNSTANYISIATTTFTLTNAGKVWFFTWGTAANNGANDGCEYELVINGASTTALAAFQNGGTAAVNENIGLNVVLSMPAGLNTVNLFGRAVTSGQCSAQNNPTFAAEYIGQ